MHDDELMDRLLKDAMSSEAPQLSKDFDANVMRAVRPRRLTQTGRVVMGAYAVAALVTAGWLMRELPMDLIAMSAVGCVAVAAGVSSYVRTLAEIS